MLSLATSAALVSFEPGCVFGQDDFPPTKRVRVVSRLGATLTAFSQAGSVRPASASWRRCGRT